MSTHSIAGPRAVEPRALEGIVQMESTVSELFLHSVERHGRAALFIRTDGLELSYLDSALRVKVLVEQLEAAGIRAGDYVCCFTEEAVELGLFILACSIIGAHAAPVSPLFSPSYLIEGVAKPLGSRTVLAPASRARELAERGLHVFYYEDEDTGVLPGPGLTRVSSEARGDPDTVVRTLRSKLVNRETFIVQLTSGTTRKPRLVPRPHHAPLRYAEFVGRQLVPRACKRHRFLLVETFNHAFGVHMFVTAMRLGAALCVTMQLSSSVRLPEIHQLRPTVLPILPRVQQALWRQYTADGEPSRERPMLPSSVEYVCSAGGPANAEILRHIAEPNTHIIEFYGSTEASIIACTPAGGWRPPSCGKLVDDVESRIEPDGELLVRSPGVMKGYIDNPETTAQALTPDGFYRTGDIAEIGPDNYLRVVGRKHDFFGTYEGSAVYPAYIEQLIEGCPWAQQVMLVGDGKPFISAMIVVRANMLPNGDNVPRMLSPTEFEALYQLAGRDLERINARLEKIEQVARFALLTAPFPDELYATVGPGKVRRNRKVFTRLYSDIVDWLYAEDVPPNHASFVPGANQRREQPRKKSHPTLC